MVTLNRIYTRTGDQGLTRLSTGEPVSKASLRVEAYGGVDETNACVGLARQHTAADAELDAVLERIQNDLFDLGADLATPEQHEKPAWEPLRIVQSQVDRLEGEIDRMNAELSPLTSFVLPAGSAASAALHLARTVCRRAERSCVLLAATEGEIVGAPALKYLNRLSDL
ncbi:MAG: ATP/cobalamin adenosyltransferase, partial [Caulobacter sp.]|nr:ATP/cobalamin adenosyltransferase [Caulobacter sp.]